MAFPPFGLCSPRLPPSNIQAEQALLGALMIDPNPDLVGLRLAAEHFVDPIHGRILQVIARRIEAKQPADTATLRADLDPSGVLGEVGGSPYLAQLAALAAPPGSLPEYAASIRDAWIRRQMIWIGEEIVNNAFGERPELDGAQQLDLAQHEIAKLAAEVSW
jgi:replicative DNA helicase